MQIYLLRTVISWFTLEKNMLEAFDGANPNLINHNLDDLDNNFKYLFPTFLSSIHDID